MFLFLLITKIHYLLVLKYKKTPIYCDVTQYFFYNIKIILWYRFLKIQFDWWFEKENKLMISNNRKKIFDFRLTKHKFANGVLDIL